MHTFRFQHWFHYLYIYMNNFRWSRDGIVFNKLYGMCEWKCIYFDWNEIEWNELRALCFVPFIFKKVHYYMYFILALWTTYNRIHLCIFFSFFFVSYTYSIIVFRSHTCNNKKWYKAAVLISEPKNVVGDIVYRLASDHNYNGKHLT